MAALPKPQESCSLEQFCWPREGSPTAASTCAPPSSTSEPRFHLRVIRIYGLPPGSPSLDGLHGCGVQGLLAHRALLIRRAVRSLRQLLPLVLVYVMNPKQEAVVHDFKAF